MGYLQIKWKGILYIKKKKKDKTTSSEFRESLKDFLQTKLEVTKTYYFN